jgi:hypothetical protein
MSFHRRYLTLVDEIERNFPVTQWICGDCGIWPLARMELYLDMYWSHSSTARPEFRPFPIRWIANASRPVRNVWRSRSDLAHVVLRPKSADAILLGDGVSLDQIDGSVRDRFGEPIVAALEQQGMSTFLMQGGSLSRLPWHRPTYAANVIAYRGVRGRFASLEPVSLPGHEAVQQFISRNDVSAPSLSQANLTRLANTVRATATLFEPVIRAVKPKLAFVVTYYADLGPAFLLACRRQGVLSVDLQHCPQDGTHKAYGWAALPDNGYATLPAVFWTWTQADAAYIRRWTDTLAAPWHSAVWGGHTQLGPFLDDSDPRTIDWDRQFSAVGSSSGISHEILVALQPVGGYRGIWESLAAEIERSPASWRWWIRRHPAATRQQDAEYAGLLSLRGPKVLIEEASLLPLPALLRHMSVAVSLSSGSAAEAAVFGVPALFLSNEARGQFSDLIDRGLGAVLNVGSICSHIAQLPKPSRPPPIRQPSIEQTLTQLQSLAGVYKRLCNDRVRQHGSS